MMLNFRWSRLIPHTLALLLFIGGFTGGFGSIQSASADGWTSFDGSATIEAKLVGLWESNAILQMNNGKRISVHVDKLNAESRIRARQVNEERIEQRAFRVNELKEIAEAEAAPAPKELPPAPEPAPYTPPKDGMTLTDACEFWDTQGQAGHSLLAFYDSLPPNFQADVDALVKMLSEKLSPEDVASLVRPAYEIADLVVTRQLWLKSSPRLQMIGLDTLVEQRIIPMASMIREFLDPNEFSVEKLRSTPFRQWLAGRDRVLASYSETFADLSPATSFEILDEKGDSGRVKISNGGPAVEASFTMVDGRWLPADLASKWEKVIADAKQGIESMPSQGTPEFANGVAMANGLIQTFIAPLKQATTADEFHEVLDKNVLAHVTPMLASLQNMKPRRPGEGMDGYGDDMYGDDMYGEDMEGYGDDMEMEMDMEGYGDDMDMEMQGGM